MVDFEYYLNQQVHPPVERMCDPIEGTDATRLADCLGLDTSKFRSAARTTSPEEELQTLSSQLSDEERFKDAHPFELRCRKCQSIYSCSALLMETVSRQIDPLGRFFPHTTIPSSANLAVFLSSCQGSITHFGLQCPNPSCKAVAQQASASVQLTGAIRKYIQKYYQGWIVCDDQACRNRTRMVGVIGRRCLVEGCQGSMQKEVSLLTLKNTCWNVLCLTCGGNYVLLRWLFLLVSVFGWKSVYPIDVLQSHL